MKPDRHYRISSFLNRIRDTLYTRDWIERMVLLNADDFTFTFFKNAEYSETKFPNLRQSSILEILITKFSPPLSVLIFQILFFEPWNTYIAILDFL